MDLPDSNFQTKKRSKKQKQEQTSVFLDLAEDELLVDLGANGFGSGPTGEQDWIFGIPNLTRLREAPLDVNMMFARKAALEQNIDALTDPDNVLPEDSTGPPKERMAFGGADESPRRLSFSGADESPRRLSFGGADESPAQLQRRVSFDAGDGTSPSGARRTSRRLSFGETPTDISGRRDSRRLSFTTEDSPQWWSPTERGSRAGQQFLSPGQAERGAEGVLPGSKLQRRRTEGSSEDDHLHDAVHLSSSASPDAAPSPKSPASPASRMAGLLQGGKKKLQGIYGHLAQMTAESRKLSEAVERFAEKEEKRCATGDEGTAGAGQQDGGRNLRSNPMDEIELRPVREAFWAAFRPRPAESDFLLLHNANAKQLSWEQRMTAMHACEGELPPGSGFKIQEAERLKKEEEAAQEAAQKAAEKENTKNAEASSGATSGKKKKGAKTKVSALAKLMRASGGDGGGDDEVEDEIDGENEEVQKTPWEIQCETRKKLTDREVTLNLSELDARFVSGGESEGNSSRSPGMHFARRNPRRQKLELILEEARAGATSEKKGGSRRPLNNLDPRRVGPGAQISRQKWQEDTTSDKKRMALIFHRAVARKTNTTNLLDAVGGDVLDGGRAGGTSSRSTVVNKMRGSASVGVGHVSSGGVVPSSTSLSSANRKKSLHGGAPEERGRFSLKTLRKSMTHQEFVKTEQEL